MAHTITHIEGVVTVRIDGRANAIELAHELKAVLDSVQTPVIVLIDFLLARELGQTVKARLHPVLQHPHVLKIAFSAISAEIGTELQDMVPILTRICPVVIGTSESDVRQKLGLQTTKTERKLTGMLSYLNAPEHVSK